MGESNNIHTRIIIRKTISYFSLIKCYPSSVPSTSVKYEGLVFFISISSSSTRIGTTIVVCLYATLFKTYTITYLCLYPNPNLESVCTIS